MNRPKIRIKKYTDALSNYKIGDIYTERKEKGEDNLPMLSVSIHSGVSDGELNDEELGKKVARSEDKTKYKKAKKDDVVFNMMRAWQGAIGVVRTTGMVSPAYIVATPNDKVFPLYMDYYLKTPKMINKINRMSYGLMDFRKRLYWDSFAVLDCMLPSIEEQREIYNLLNGVDTMIGLISREIVLWEEKKKAVSKILFSRQHDDVRPVKLKDICTYRNSSLLLPDARDEGKYYLYDAKRVVGKCETGEDADYISIIKYGAGVGRVTLREAGTNVIGTMGVIRPNDSVNCRYLYYLLQSMNFSKYIEVGTVPNLYYKDFSVENVYLPSMEEQKEIANNIMSIEMLISIKREKLEIWQNIKKGLLQQMFV